MFTHKRAGAIIPSSGGLSMTELQAPERPGDAFLGGIGWVGAQCACGWIVTARNLAGVRAAITDHQVPRVCIITAEIEAAELEDEVTITA